MTEGKVNKVGNQNYQLTIGVSCVQVQRDNDNNSCTKGSIRLTAPDLAEINLQASLSN